MGVYGEGAVRISFRKLADLDDAFDFYTNLPDIRKRVNVGDVVEYKVSKTEKPRSGQVVDIMSSDPKHETYRERVMVQGANFVDNISVNDITRLVQDNASPMPNSLIGINFPEGVPKMEPKSSISFRKLADLDDAFDEQERVNKRVEDYKSGRFISFIANQRGDSDLTDFSVYAWAVGSLPPELVHMITNFMDQTFIAIGKGGWTYGDKYILNPPELRDAVRSTKQNIEEAVSKTAPQYTVVYRKDYDPNEVDGTRGTRHNFHFVEKE